jgi:phosphopantothenoylcysteine decarboxylase/phosphopantothenate--cysteine ligase
VTAGPTREAIDPVRYLGNRSSGHMGYALAQAAWRRGARVSLVSGPSHLDLPEGVDFVRVETALEMRDAVLALIPSADVAVFAAAVADFRAAEARDRKMKRGTEGPELSISLTANPDIASETRAQRKPGSIAVGFALETEDVLEHAAKKLRAKGFDLLVANNALEAGAGFEVPTNRVTLLSADSVTEELPMLTKEEVAEEVLDRVAARLTTSA